MPHPSNGPFLDQDGLTYYDAKVKERFVAKVTGKGLSTNDYTTAEKTKLAGIEAGAKANVQADYAQTDTTADDYIKNKPVLATVATTGDYGDLTGTPTLAIVATTGDYSDLTGTPEPYTLPTASASTLGGIKVGANLSIDVNGVLSASGGGGGSVDTINAVDWSALWQ